MTPAGQDLQGKLQKIFSPPKVVLPLDSPATFLYSRDGSDEVEKSKSYPGVSPEVNERIDAGVA